MRRRVGGAVLAALLAVSPGAVGAERETAPGWNEKMRGLARTLQSLLVNLASDARFADRRNFKTIERDARQLAKLAHAMRAKPAPDADPTLRLVGDDFADDADAAAKAYAAGNRAYARILLNSITNYCVACHTRGSDGPRYANLPRSPELRKLDPLARGKYLVATREFDEALQEFRAVAADSAKAGGEPFAYEKAVRASLAIAVRVKADPDLALRTLQDALVNPRTPHFLRALARDWRESVVEWKASNSPARSDVAAAFDEAVRLVAAARARQRYPADRSADILYLRASAALHGLLGRELDAERGARALLLAGLVYDVLEDYGIRDFGQLYFRACVRRLPHSATALECYRKYEEDVYFGYTGSGGTFVPSDVRARLDRLELLATPIPAPSAQPDLR